MKTKKTTKKIGGDFFEKLWGDSWTYIKTVVDVVCEPMLILDKDFRVLAANEPFYKVFDVKSKETENKIVYELGNGQWDIPALRKLLEDILPKHTFFKGFEITHDFPKIGHKVMILNARQIYFREGLESKRFPPIILLAIEDVTEMMEVAAMLARHTNQFENKMTEQTDKLEGQIKELEKQLSLLQKNK